MSLSVGTEGGLGGLVDRVHARLLDDGSGSVERTEVTAMVRRHAPLLGGDEVRAVVDRVLARVGGLGPLEDLLDDPAVTDVLVNGPGAVWVERAGALECTDLVLSVDEIERIIERVVSPLGLRVDRSSPLVDARLPDGSRVNAVVPPLAVDGPCLAIRRFGISTRPLADLCGPEVEALLRWAVRSRANVVVSGGTGAGKTTLLNALASELAPTERLITVEDTAELRLPHPHVLRLEARPANTDGVGRVSIRQLVRNALRLRPDRIIVGEVRGAEALDMLQAMNTGHEGSLSTCHANTPADALRRLETMILLDGSIPLEAVRDQLSAAVDLVVQIERRRDGSRFVTSVGEVDIAPGADGRVGVRPVAVDAAVVEPLRRPPRTPAALGTDFLGPAA